MSPPTTKNQKLTTLQQEIRQSVPFDSVELEAHLNISRTANVLAGKIQPIVKAEGLAESQYNALRIVRGAGKDCIPCLEIAARLVTRVPDITRLVDKLEKAGLVKRKRSTEDRRVVHIVLTAKGRKVIEKLEGPLNRTHRDNLKHMTRKELEDLNRLLVKARHPP